MVGGCAKGAFRTGSPCGTAGASCGCECGCGYDCDCDCAPVRAGARQAACNEASAEAVGGGSTAEGCSRGAHGVGSPCGTVGKHMSGWMGTGIGMSMGMGVGINGSVGMGAGIGMGMSMGRGMGMGVCMGCGWAVSAGCGGTATR